MRAFLYIVWILLIVAAVVHAEHYGKSITTDSAAVAAANEITGFGEYYAQRGAEPPIASVTPEVYRDSTTPFLHDSLDGLASWKVVYSGIEKVLEGLLDSVKIERQPTTLTLWLDSAQGSLLSCLILESAPRPTSALLAPSGVEEMKTSEYNVTSGLPRDLPVITLLDALSTWKKFAAYGHYIIVTYVTMTYQSKESFAAWNLVFPGVHMKPSNYQDAVYAVDVWVDATTGRCSPIGQISGPAIGSPDAGE